MKKLVTLIVCGKYDKEETAPLEEIEFLYTDEARECGTIIKNAAKQAKGKYICLLDPETTYKDAQALVNALSDKSCDMVVLNGCICFKTSIIRGLDINDNFDRQTAEIFAAMSSKSVVKTEATPFEYIRLPVTYSENAEKNLAAALDEFKKDKQKFDKSVYSAVFELICNKLNEYYASAVYAAYKKQIDSERIVQFDLKLKSNIVLYLAMEKRFTCAKLKSLRKNKFKISVFTAPKFKKFLNIK